MSERRQRLQLVEQSRPADVSVRVACKSLGISRSVLYRSRKGVRRSAEDMAASRSRKNTYQPRQLSEVEEKKVLEVLNSERFEDQPPREVYHRLLSEGEYLCSVRTMHRILTRNKLDKDRRGQRAAQRHAVPRLRAEKPNEVWCWDITKLATHTRGTYLSLYVVMDLFSRFVVAWMLSEKENSGLAQQLMRASILNYGVEAGSGLTVHQDRGSPMTAHQYLYMMQAELGVTCSHSRPRVSNDNPHAESSFRTLKYQPDYPGRFHSAAEGRQWCEAYFRWHNFEHHHVGLSGFTPHEVFSGNYQTVQKRKQQALSAFY